VVINRRNFLTSSGAAVLGARVLGGRVWAQQPAAAPPPAVPRFFDIRGGVGYFTARGGAIGWFASPDGIVVVDSQFPDTAPLCLEGLKGKSPKGIDTLFNTHHHGDHTGGNKVFRPAVKKIVAHARVPELQKAAAVKNNNEAAQAYPDSTFPDTWKMTMGSETISAKHYGPGHTGGDIVVFFEKANVVHMGDLMFNRLHPFVDRAAGASIANWIKTLEQVGAAHGADASYIFGHGKEDLGVIGKEGDLMVFRDYLTAVLDTTRKGIQAGKSKEEIAKQETLDGFTEFFSPAPFLSLPKVLETAYDELTAKA
jgi:glyoxylase-like metal-dependent hydrolase (beta-lactamase superfamily II)